MNSIIKQKRDMTEAVVILMKLRESIINDLTPAQLDVLQKAIDLTTPYATSAEIDRLYYE